jgi:CheY-like chemotaxis protein
MAIEALRVNGFLTWAPESRHLPLIMFGEQVESLWGTALRLLLVEDEPFIALDLQMLSTSAGHDVVGVADTFATAIDLAAAETPEAALVDINLRDGFSGLQISRALSDGGCRAVAFVTGNAEQIPADFAGAVAVLDKPYTEAGVEEMLSILQATCDGRQADADRPCLYVRLAHGA